MGSKGALGCPLLERAGFENQDNRGFIPPFPLSDLLFQPGFCFISLSYGTI